MGLCKCPKRKVTNQFCFEHRVNVCEYCMVNTHPKCIVQSYLQWLQDSDYNPICELCEEPLANDDCLRLVCYHVFHIKCLNQYARALPPTTAPAGYTCPSCNVGLFPVENLVSPVADIFLQKVAGFNWARAGLGLPLLFEEKDGTDDSSYNSNAVRDFNKRSHTPDQAALSSNRVDAIPHSVVNVEDQMSSFSRTEGFVASGQVPRRIIEALDDSRGSLIDHDENKYERRSAVEWFSRRWKSVIGPLPYKITGGSHGHRRYLLAALLLITGLITITVIFSWLGGMATENDPNLDPLQNPHIIVNRRN